jgi:hypothetical protein
MQISHDINTLFILAVRECVCVDVGALVVGRSCGVWRKCCFGFLFFSDFGTRGVQIEMYPSLFFYFYFILLAMGVCVIKFLI